MQESAISLCSANAKSGFLKGVSKGGGAAEKGKMSSSSMRKYKPHELRKAQYQDMICSSCQQRYNAVAYLERNGLRIINQ